MIKAKEGLIDILQSTTIHGLNHVYSAKTKCSKIFWFSLFFVGVACLVFHVISLVEKYLLNAVLMTQFVDNEDFLWPDLTFCNPTSPFNLNRDSSSYRHWLKTMDKTKNIMKTLSKGHKLFRAIKTLNGDESEMIEHSLLMSTVDPAVMNLDDFRQRIFFYGYSMQHMKIYLTKENDLYSSIQITENLEELFHTQFVQIRHNIPCHTFQISKSKTINNRSVQAIKFFVNMNYESYEIFNSSYIPRYFLLHVNDRNNLPKASEIIAMPGHNNELIISQTRYHNLNSRNPCRKDLYKIELYDTLLQSTDVYEGDYEDCIKVISQKLYVKHCQCYSPYLPIYKNVSGFPRLCFNASIFTEQEIVANADCMFEVFTNYSSNSSFETFENGVCKIYKMLKCDVLTYETIPRRHISLELNSGQMNDRMRMMFRKVYGQLFNKSISDEDFVRQIKENIAIVSMKRTSEHGNLVKESLEYSYPNLLSDIGGLMGFSLGLSAIGLIEMIGLVYFLFLRLCGFEVTRIQRIKEEKAIEEDDELNTL